MTYSFLDTLMEKVIHDEFIGLVKEKGINWNQLAESYAIKMLAAIENVLDKRIPDSEKINMITRITYMAANPTQNVKD